MAKKKQSPDAGQKNRRSRRSLGLGSFNVALPGGLTMSGTGVIGLPVAAVIGGFIVLIHPGAVAAGDTHTEQFKPPAQMATRSCRQSVMIDPVSLHHRKAVEASLATPPASMAEP